MKGCFNFEYNELNGIVKAVGDVFRYLLPNVYLQMNVKFNDDRVVINIQRLRVENIFLFKHEFTKLTNFLKNYYLIWTLLYDYSII